DVPQLLLERANREAEYVAQRLIRERLAAQQPAQRLAYRAPRAHPLRIFVHLDEPRRSPSARYAGNGLLGSHGMRRAISQAAKAPERPRAPRPSPAKRRARRARGRVRPCARARGRASRRRARTPARAPARARARTAPSPGRSTGAPASARFE